MLTQTKYIRELLYKSKMDEAKLIGTPMQAYTTLFATNNEMFDNPTFYRNIVGTL